jgi:hypothetical protein
MPEHDLREGLWNRKQAKRTLSRETPRWHANSHLSALEAL